MPPRFRSEVLGQSELVWGESAVDETEVRKFGETEYVRGLPVTSYLGRFLFGLFWVILGNLSLYPQPFFSFLPLPLLSGLRGADGQTVLGPDINKNGTGVRRCVRSQRNWRSGDRDGGKGVGHLEH